MYIKMYIINILMKDRIIPVLNYVIKQYTLKAYGREELQLYHSWPQH
jgi:hypothetical protein